MGEQLSPEQTELYRRVDEVLHYLWDPIGVYGIPEGRDDYNSYLPHVFSLLVHHAPEREIIDFLVNTETQTMELPGTERALGLATEIVSILTNYRDVTHERAAARN